MGLKDHYSLNTFLYSIWQGIRFREGKLDNRVNWFDLDYLIRLKERQIDFERSELVSRKGKVDSRKCDLDLRKGKLDLRKANWF